MFPDTFVAGAAQSDRYVSNGGEIVHRLLVLLLASSLTACAAEHAHEGEHAIEGPVVREIHPDMATKCQFLSALDASEDSGWDERDDRQNALNSLRNQVALMGGNAFVVIQSTTSGSQTSVQADVYRCP